MKERIVPPVNAAPMPQPITQTEVPFNLDEVTSLKFPMADYAPQQKDYKAGYVLMSANWELLPVFVYHKPKGKNAQTFKGFVLQPSSQKQVNKGTCSLVWDNQITGCSIADIRNIRVDLSSAAKGQKSEILQIAAAYKSQVEVGLKDGKTVNGAIGRLNADGGTVLVQEKRQ